MWESAALCSQSAESQRQHLYITQEVDETTHSLHKTDAFDVFYF